MPKPVLIGAVCGILSALLLGKRIGWLRASALIPIWVLAADSSLASLRDRIFVLMHGPIPAGTPVVTPSQAEQVWLRFCAVLPIALTFSALGALLIAYLRDENRQRAPEQCPACGYDLTGNVSGVCPECGTVTPPSRGARDSKAP